MNAQVKSNPPPEIGAQFGGGFFAGLVLVNGAPFALIVAPKDGGEIEGKWSSSYDSVAAAVSYCDGKANTAAMAAAGSDLAETIIAMEINGVNDWYLPSQDELEILYRAFKPTDDKNSLYGRSGINLSAVPPARPYEPGSPLQTVAAAFVEGAAEAFTDDWYWSSTQHAAGSDCAWGQYFGYGLQGHDSKSYEGRARAVRRLPI